MAAATTAAAEAGLQYTPIDAIPGIVSDLRAAFLTGKTRSIEYRKNQLKQLAYMFKDHQDDFIQSLQKDLGRSRFESVFAELMGTTNEIVETVNKLDKWAKPAKPWAGLAGLPTAPPSAPSPRAPCSSSAPGTTPSPSRWAP